MEAGYTSGDKVKKAFGSGQYLVSGGEAVKIALGPGKRFRLGANEPQRLAQILLAAKRVPPHP